MSRWAWAEVDLGAIARNVALLRRRAEGSDLWVVVKADAYGHGATTVARTALDAGASGLCVALAQEAQTLRIDGIDAPILVLSEQPPEALMSMVTHRIAATVYSDAQIRELDRACAQAGIDRHPVHLKIDTGMRRVGCDSREAVPLARSIDLSEHLDLAGVFTHLPVADEPDDPFTRAQVARFDQVLVDLAAIGHRPTVHIANSAGLLAHRDAHRSVVRAGIAAYGIVPGPGVAAHGPELEPALSLVARVSFVKRVTSGERISYGLRHTFGADTTVATVPIGYADGVPRRWSAVGGEVLIGGRRRPIVGVVTMDQLMVDVGDDAVERGDPVVLIGRQGDDEISATEMADRLGTIAYEIVCGISKRIERRYH